MFWECFPLTSIMFHFSVSWSRRLAILLLNRPQAKDWELWRKLFVFFLSQCVLEWHEYTRRNFHFWNSCNIETWSCCFSKRCIWTNPSLRILNFRASGKHFAILVPSTPMNSAVNFSFLLIIRSESFHQFWDFGWKSIFLVEFVGGNINPLPFSNRNSMVHGIRKNQFLHRMSFLDAGFVQLCSRSFVFFCNSSLSK